MKEVKLYGGKLFRVKKGELLESKINLALFYNNLITLY